MGTEENKHLVKRFVTEVINQGNLDALGEFIHPQMLDHTPTDAFPSGPERMEMFFSMLLEAFPDLEVHIEDLLAVDDKVVARMKWKGTHKAPFMDVAATGRTVEFGGIHIVRFQDEKMIEHWGPADLFNVMHQLGLLGRLPTPVNLN